MIQIKQLLPIKEALKDLGTVGEEEHEGSLIDIAIILSRIVVEYEEKGIDYILEKYS